MFYKHKSEEVFTIATEKMDLLWFKHYCLSFWYHQMGEENYSSLSVLVNKGTVQPFGLQGESVWMQTLIFHNSWAFENF